MIAVDTSALVAVGQAEARAEQCIARLRTARRLLISAGTVSEFLVVCAGRGLLAQAEHVLSHYGMTILDVTPAVARKVGEAYARWGKGMHPAGLNFGDCFAYVTAKEHGCPLLYVGEDFARTDVTSALAVGEA